MSSVHWQVSTLSESHVQFITLPHTSGHPALESDSVRVAGVSSAIIGFSVTVTMAIVIPMIIVTISLTVIILLCQCRGTCGDNELLYLCHLLHNTWHFAIFHAALNKVKAPSPTESVGEGSEGDDQMEDVTEVQLQSNPAYQAVNMS